MSGQRNLILIHVLLFLCMSVGATLAQNNGAENEVNVVVGITGDADTGSNPLPSDVFGAPVSPVDGDTNVQVSARSVSGNNTNSTKGADNNSSGGVSVEVIVLATLGGLALLVLLGLSIYYFNGNPNTSKADNVNKNNKSGPIHPTTIIHPAHSARQGLFSQMHVMSDNGNRGYYNKIIQLDLVHPVLPSAMIIESM
jgi:hypothetical protein